MLGAKTSKFVDNVFLMLAILSAIVFVAAVCIPLSQNDNKGFLNILNSCKSQVHLFNLVNHDTPGRTRTKGAHRPGCPANKIGSLSSVMFFVSHVTSHRVIVSCLKNNFPVGSSTPATGCFLALSEHHGSLYSLDHSVITIKNSKLLSSSLSLAFSHPNYLPNP